MEHRQRSVGPKRSRWLATLLVTSMAATFAFIGIVFVHLMSRGYIQVRLGSLSAQRQASQIHFNRGVSFLRSGQQKAAINEFRAALRVDPNNTYAQANLGFTLLASGQVDDAIPELEKALMNPPPGLSATLHWALGDALMQKAQYKQAALEYEQALKAERGSFRVMIQTKLAEALLRAGDLDKSIEVLKISLASEGIKSGEWSDVNIRILLANAYREKGLEALAAKELEQVVSELGEENCPQVIYELALLYERQGRKELAEQKWRRLLEIAQSNSQYRNWVAIAKRHLIENP